MAEALDDTLTLIECQNSTTHDGAVAIYHRGKVAALEAERADRIKHSAEPSQAYTRLKSWLFAEKPPIDVVDNFSPTYTPHQEISHHLGHAASVFFGSDFVDAAILVADGMGPAATRGESTSTSMWHGKGSKLRSVWELSESGMCLRSLGHFYSAITYYLGFGFYDQSHTMSLAAYGNPAVYRSAISKLLWMTPDGAFDVDRNFIRYTTHVRFGADFGWPADPVQVGQAMEAATRILGPLRHANEDIVQRHYDIAAAAQEALENCLVSLLDELFKKARSENLCFAGGVALNCVANERAFRRSKFKNMFILSSPGDSGIALGKLFYRLHGEYGFPRGTQKFSPYLGPLYDAHSAIEKFLRVSEKYDARKLEAPQLAMEIVRCIGAGAAVGIFQGRSEFGPRALGNRSILCDPRRKDCIDIINGIKKREPFRPLAPSVMLSQMGNYFSNGGELPFMARAVPANDNARHVVPAVVHIDGTSRVQSVSNPRMLFHGVLEECQRELGAAIVVNTSLNQSGSPIVETPDEALVLLRDTNLRHLVLDDWIIQKKG